MQISRLSVCLIVKDEEPVIRRCLSAVSRIADELIVVDTGSADRTAEIAKEYTPYVYLHLWQNSFAEARNYSYSKATGDYIMWMDADDVVSEENIARFNTLKAEGTDADVIFTLYKEYSESGLTNYILRDRIVKRSVFRKWLYDVHEAIPTQPEWKRSYRPDLEIIHKKEHVNDPERNMGIFARLLEARKPLEPFEKANLVKEYSLHEKAEEALSLFRELRASDAGYEYALVFLVQALLRAERWEDCLGVIGEAEGHFLPTAQMIFSKGRCMEALGDEQRAEELYRGAMAVTENSLPLSIRFTGYSDYYPYLRLAAMAKNSGDLKKALCLLRCAGKAYPGDNEWLLMSIAFLLNRESLTDSHNSHSRNTVQGSREAPGAAAEKTERLRAMLLACSDDELELLISGAKKPSARQLAAYAEACLQLKTVYYWGGMGQPLTQEMLTRSSAQYPDHFPQERILSLNEIADGSIRAFDCSGLIKCFQMGGLAQFRYDPALDRNAHSMLCEATCAGALDSLPECPGICLYMEDHVGIYAGSGEVIEATSNPRFGNGVIKTKLSDRLWEKWFCCRGITYPDFVIG